MFENMFENMFKNMFKSSKISQKVDNAICPIEKVNNDAKRPINPIEEHFSVLYLSILFFYAPNVANLGFLRIKLKIAL